MICTKDQELLQKASTQTTTMTRAARSGSIVNLGEQQCICNHDKDEVILATTSHSLLGHARPLVVCERNLYLDVDPFPSRFKQLY